MLVEAQASAILALTADAIVSADAEQRIVYYNDAAEQLFGHARADVLGRDLVMLLPERYRAKHADQVRDFGSGAIAARRMGERGGVAVLRKDGSEVPAEASITRAVVGGEVYYTAALRDVSERLRADREREALLSAALEATRQRDEVLSVVSHDLRTPLAGIGMTASLVERMLKAHPELASLVEPLAEVSRTVQRMDALIGDLLAVVREGSAPALERGPVAAWEVAAELERAMQPQALRAAVTLEVSDPGELMHYADRRRLHQVLANLVGNALKFTPRGGKVVVRVEPGPGQMVRWWVTDTGPGIACEHQDKVFERFWQAPGSNAQGTGLGLAIASDLVHAHGGQIGLEGAPGEGCRFWFTIPATAPLTRPE